MKINKCDQIISLHLFIIGKSALWSPFRSPPWYFLSIHQQISSLFLLSSGPNHLFPDYHLTCAVSLMYSLLSLSIIITPEDIFISAFCLLLSAKQHLLVSPPSWISFCLEKLLSCLCFSWIYKRHNAAPPHLLGTFTPITSKQILHL